MGGGRRFRNRGGKHRAYYKEKAKQEKIAQRQGRAIQATRRQRLGTRIVLQNGDGLMRQMRFSLRLRAAAYDSWLDDVAARGRSFLSAFALRVMTLSDTLEQKRSALRVMLLVLVE